MRWLIVLLFVIPAIASANNQSLDDARKAVDEIRYDDARRLLVEALKQGANRPAELVEIYRLSAATAAVLGPTNLAEQYYRRMLALDPDATIPPDASPRLREPFVAAQAYMAAQQRFDVRVTRTEHGIEATLVDPLRMTLAIAVVANGVVRSRTLVAIAAAPGGGARGSLCLIGEPTWSCSVTLRDEGDTVVALDEHGNFLRVMELGSPPVADETVTLAIDRPWYRRWYVWAVPAAAFAGATTYMFVDASRARDRLDTLLASSNGHYFDEAEAERRRWRNGTIIGWIGVGVTVGLVTTAIVVARSGPRSVTVTPSVGSDHASVQLEAKF